MKNAGGKIIVAKFGELWLRGKNRSDYISILVGNINMKLSGERFVLDKLYDRIVIRPDEKSFESVLQKMSTLFGISAYEVTKESAPKLQAIVKESIRAMEDAKGKGAFRINAHRAHKQHKFNSEKIVAELAGAAEKKGIKVSPKKYSREINISVTKDIAYISMQRFKGLGGLPVGSSGRCIVLFSGGIDSPVAAWLAMKRGLEPVYVHMHAFPKNEDSQNSKIGSLIGMLSKYHERHKAYYIPTHRFQMAALGSGRYELLMLKRFMLKTAEKLLEKEESSMIVTGESLGQVASQTQANLFAEEQGIKASLIRPLVCFDKSEIVALAKGIGTFDESVKPYRDVCSISARHPVINSDPETVLKIEKRMKLDSVVSSAIKSAKIVESGVR